MTYLIKIKFITILLLSFNSVFSQGTNYVNKLEKSFECIGIVIYPTNSNSFIVINENYKPTTDLEKGHYYIKTNLEKKQSLLNVLKEHSILNDIYKPNFLSSDHPRKNKGFKEVVTGEVKTKKNIELIIAILFDTECGGDQIYFLVSDNTKAIMLLSEFENIFDENIPFQKLINEIKN